MSKEFVSVVMPGTKVTVNGHDAVVLQVALAGKPPRVTYELAWWDGGSRRTSWINDFEFSEESIKQQIGPRPVNSD